jgi:predicted acylesterase/phospholipase RssA
MSDPVPAEVVYEMGADICISINVIPRPRKGGQTAITRLSHKLNRLNPLAYFGDAEMPNTFDVVMNSIQTLHHELGKFRSMSADVRIQPDLSEFTWTDFDRADELIERGADATIEALPAIRRVLDDKIDGHGARN